MEWNFLGSDYDTHSSFYGSMKAMEPVHAQLNLDDGSVDVIRLGATGEAADLLVRVRVYGLDGKVLSEMKQKVHAAANARTPVAKLELAQVATGHTVLVRTRGCRREWRAGQRQLLLVVSG